MIFHLEADAFIDAEDIDDALLKLEKHFRKIRDFKDSYYIHKGNISLSEYIESPKEYFERTRGDY